MLGRSMVAAFGGLCALAGTAFAQDWPARPLTLVVPYAAGGSVDGNGRTMAQRMGEILSQQVVVENVGGAGGMTGSLRVSRAAPDGYSFVIGKPMTMLFNAFEIAAIVLSVFATSMVVADGESNWVEGLQLMSIYVLLGMAFYFVP